MERHSEVIKHAVYSIKRHMFVKKRETSKFIDEWDKVLKKIKSWSKDIAEASKRYYLENYFREFWKYPHMVTQ